MEGYISNNFVIRKVMFLFQIIGEVFLIFPRCCSVVRRYVLVDIAGSDAEREDEREDTRFAGEIRSLLYLCKSANITKGFKEDFREFHDFSLSCWHPNGFNSGKQQTIVSPLQKSISCGRKTTCCDYISYLSRNVSWLENNKMLSAMQNLRALRLLDGKW